MAYPWWLRLWDWAFSSPMKTCLRCGARKWRETMVHYPGVGFFCNVDEYELFRWIHR
jgi:hypothetical protein